MKKLLLCLSLICSVLLAYSQSGCTPGSYTSPGIYPDTAIGLTDAFVGLSYSENITIITPLDTNIDLGAGPVTLSIDSINLTNVTGLPYGFDYACDPPNCSFPGGTSSCAELYSTTPPDDSLIGVHNVVFSITTYAPTIAGQITQTDIIDYYSIEISAVSSTINKVYSTSFELKAVYPNPVEDHAKIQFISGKSEDIIFRVYNLLGKEVESQIILSTRGVNTIDINTSSYSEGVYLYSINNGTQLVTKRMVVKN